MGINSLDVTLFSTLAEIYIEENYVEEARPMFSLRGKAGVEPVKKPEADAAAPPQSVPRYSIQSSSAPLDDALREVSRGGDAFRALSYLSRTRQKTFSEQLWEYIDASGRNSASVYKAAGIDRKLFSKIRSDKDYKPSKDTCISLALALRLEEDKAKDLLKKAGFALSNSNKRDLILEFFFRERKYDLDLVNGVLDRLGEKSLGKIDYSK